MTKQLILVAEGLGTTEATTAGGFLALRSGFATGGRLVVVGAWAREVVRRYRGEDLGVELVLTSPHPILGYRPLTHAPTLMGGEGTFPTTTDDLLEHADAGEVYRELRAQLERAILWGISVSHLAILHDAVWPRADLADAVFDLADEFRVALRLTPSYSEANLGYDAYILACNRGIATIDHTLKATPAELSTTDALLHCISKEMATELDGIIELALSFAANTPEIRSFGSREIHIIDPHSFTQQAAILKELLQQRHVESETYRRITHARQQQRKA
ncbi:ChbG/HpnK family deacetylase [Ferrimicrobium acidiphilum]|uniref:ChbG/HpnK family deacetylase n=1 Tax=Ferrimicrobium acidiphilum DSM 19497 TaxID=1121877 RepID=A0A0D8FY14_9ACTN|nr:ChbG/HpnK family deacetylase [Ferrimicrobium acidiphilum]KJE78158.1 hypothetical protein FEAC_01500 [Ferrimicrobium acidiphilum DSM 19497]MCL5053594.1 ChbG/HpnK family deacetylase [Gammaproteobacteria bacterium]